MPPRRLRHPTQCGTAAAHADGCSTLLLSCTDHSGKCTVRSHRWQPRCPQQVAGGAHSSCSCRCSQLLLLQVLTAPAPAPAPRRLPPPPPPARRPTPTGRKFPTQLRLRPPLRHATFCPGLRNRDSLTDLMNRAPLDRIHRPGRWRGGGRQVLVSCPISCRGRTGQECQRHARAGIDAHQRLA